MDFDPFKYKISELSRLPAAKGNALIAEPFMQDPYFKRSVVLLTDHSSDGSTGFILNHPLNVRLNELLPDPIPDFDAPIFLGGPVQPQSLFYIHQLEELEGKETINENLYWDGNFEQLKAILTKGGALPGRVRFFLGYSGWESQQLQNEIDAESWLIHSISELNVMNTQTQYLWKNMLSSMGKQQSQWAQFPEDPSLN